MATAGLIIHASQVRFLPLATNRERLVRWGQRPLDTPREEGAHLVKSCSTI